MIMVLVLAVLRNSPLTNMSVLETFIGCLGWFDGLAPIFAAFGLVPLVLGIGLDGDRLGMVTAGKGGSLLLFI